MNINETWLAKQNIAHRGLHSEGVPENSLPAYKNAIEKNYAIEIDVKPLADGNIVVFHDDKLCRLTGTDGYITSLTLPEVKKLKLLKTNETIPTFEEVLKFVNGRVPLLIEIKNMNKVGFEKDVWKILSSYKGEYAIQSFNPYSLEWFKLNVPSVKRGQLSCFFENENLNCIKKFALKRMLLNKKVSEPHFISYNMQNLPNRYVKKYSNLPLLAWVVKSQEDYEKISNIATNIIFEGFEPKNIKK